MTAAVRVLLVTKGHPFEREPFLAMFDALADGGKIADVLSNAPKSADGFFVVPKVVE